MVDRQRDAGVDRILRDDLGYVDQSLERSAFVLDLQPIEPPRFTRQTLIVELRTSQDERRWPPAGQQRVRFALEHCPGLCRRTVPAEPIARGADVQGGDGHGGHFVQAAPACAW